MNCILLPSLATHCTEYILDNQNQIEHITQVLNLTIGDTLKVGIMSGNIGTARIANMMTNVSSSPQKHKNKIDQIALVDIQCDRAPPAKLDLTIVLALPRPKVLRRLVMDMTAVGVAHIILVNSYRTDKSYWQSPLLARLDEFVVEGLQQGVDTIPPKLSLRKRFRPFVEDELRMLAQHKRAVVAHPYAQNTLNAYQTENGLPQILCIGAEGGWINFEVDLLCKNSCEAVNMGNRILRTEAVVNALCGRYL